MAYLAVVLKYRQDILIKGDLRRLIGRHGWRLGLCSPHGHAGQQNTNEKSTHMRSLGGKSDLRLRVRFLGSTCIHVFVLSGPPAKSLQGPHISLIADGAKCKVGHGGKGCFKSAPFPGDGINPEEMRDDDGVRSTMRNDTDPQSVSTCRCVPNGEFISCAWMNCVMREDRLDRPGHARVKIAKGF